MSTRSRRAAAELAGHRRRLLECAVDPDLDPADALLLRVDPAGHRAGLARIAEAAQTVAGNRHQGFQAAASDSRPPELGHNGTAGTEVKVPAAVDFPPEPPRDFPRGPMAHTDLRPTDVTSPGIPIAGGVGEGAAPSANLSQLPLAGPPNTAARSVTDPQSPAASALPTAWQVGGRGGGLSGLVGVGQRGMKESKGPASDSRPPLSSSGIEGSPTTDGTSAPQSKVRTDLRPTASADAFSAREGESDSHKGEGATPSTACLLPVGGEDATQLQER